MVKINLKEEISLLVIVDVINGFIYEGALADISIEKIIQPIKQIANAYIAHEQPIIAFIDCHDDNASEFATYPPHCLRDTSESKLVSDLEKIQDQMILIEKNSTNGFVTDEFLSFLNQFYFDSIVVTGCCTDICVLQFALALKGFINEHNLNTRIIIPKNMVETFNSEQHQQAYYNEISLQLLSNAGIEIPNAIEIEV